MNHSAGTKSAVRIHRIVNKSRAVDARPTFTRLLLHVPRIPMNNSVAYY